MNDPLALIWILNVYGSSEAIFLRESWRVCVCVYRKCQNPMYFWSGPGGAARSLTLSSQGGWMQGIKWQHGRILKAVKVPIDFKRKDKDKTGQLLTQRENSSFSAWVQISWVLWKKYNKISSSTQTFPSTPLLMQFPQSPAGPLFGRGAIDFIKTTCGAHYRMMTASWEVNKKSIWNYITASTDWAEASFHEPLPTRSGRAERFYFGV